MDTINANELIAAGYTFTIEDERTERGFSADGELIGVRCDFSGYSCPSEDIEEYIDNMENEPDLIGTGIEDGALLDDEPIEFGVNSFYSPERQRRRSYGKPAQRSNTASRWAHEEDSWDAYWDSLRETYRCLDVERRPWQEKKAIADFRYNRFVRLSHWAESCNSRKQLRHAMKEVWKRYKKSVAVCVAKEEWSHLYLTKDQANSLIDYMKERYDAVVRA